MKARAKAYANIKHLTVCWVDSSGAPIHPVTHFCEDITFVSQSEGTLFK
jgi:hypothetical protein